MEPAVDLRLIAELVTQNLNRQSDTAMLRHRLYLALRQAILDKRLPAGTRLPATRTLATELGLGRNTVIRAYEKLLVEGYLAGRTGSGTFVTDALRHTARTLPSKPAAARRDTLSKRGREIAHHATASSIQRGAFMPGIPDIDLFPLATWRRLVAKHLNTGEAALLHYAHGGYGPLKVALAEYLRVTRMMSCHPRQILVVNGSHQAFDLCARMLCDVGDRVWMEQPGYWGASNVLRAAGLDLVPIPLDEGGIAPTEDDWARPPRLIFTSPSSQYPTGIVLALDRRLELLEGAERCGSWIIEDDYDNELRYHSHPIASLFGLSAKQRVLYIGTFSKVMFPGLRLAYIVIPEDLVDAFYIGNAELYRGGRMAEQAALAEFIAEGHYSAHLKRSRAVYQERRDTLLREIDARLGGLVTVSGGHAGLHLLYTFQQPVDDVLLAAQALAAGVIVRPLSLYYLDQKAARPPGMNLGYAAVPVERIGPACAKLAGVVERLLAEERKGTPRRRASA
jgi:GntR family transcriptional regulator / MocR family aminotransferase